MFAVIKQDNVVGFITLEEQKAFLVEQDPTTTFAEFSWHNDNTDPNNVLFPDDVVVNNDGTVTVLKEPNP